MRVVPGLVLIALLAGCGPAQAPAAPSPSVRSLEAPPSRVTDNFGQKTYRGTLRLSSGCVLLVVDQVTFVLIGPATAGLHDGDQVEVKGLPAPEAEVGCAGSPLRVTSATRL